MYILLSSECASCIGCSMERKWWNLLLVLFIGYVGLGQVPLETIHWQEKSLEWSDFAGSPDAYSSFHASTNSGISYSWSLRSSESKTEFLYKIETYFYPNLSWVKPGKNSPLLLAHEQVHFDITELHGRKLEKMMTGYVPHQNSDLKKVLERMYQKNETSRRLMQEKYDRETSHGQDEEAQIQWEIFIEGELAKLKEYSF